MLDLVGFGVVRGLLLHIKDFPLHDERIREKRETRRGSKNKSEREKEKTKQNKTKKKTKRRTRKKKGRGMKELSPHKKPPHQKVGIKLYIFYVVVGTFGRAPDLVIFDFIFFYVCILYIILYNSFKKKSFCVRCFVCTPFKKIK